MIKSIYILVLCYFSLVISFRSPAQTAGTTDLSFNSGTGANSGIISVAVQNDGKIIAGGGFTNFNNINKNRIVKLNIDGSLDPTFSSTVAANNTIYQVGVLSSGKILACGQFTDYGGAISNRVVRINANGSRDATFITSVGANNFIYSFVEQPDGKVLISGGFTLYGGSSRNRVARINTNGSVDATFTPGTGANNTINSVALQSDGKILIGGIFSSYAGTSRVRLARLNSNGTLDASFIIGTGVVGTGTTSTVYDIAVQTNGKILVGGLFTTYNGTPKNNLMRLNSDGSLDATFNSGLGPNGGYVKNIILQPDGKIIIVGSFTSYNGIPKSRIVRLNSDGTIDNTFLGTGGNNSILCGALQPNGELIIGGNFTTYSGDTRINMARVFATCPSLSVSISSQINNLCYNDSLGSATVSATGGSSFTYTWLPSGGNNYIANNLSAGTYSCIINNECSNSSTVSVIITEAPSINLTTATNSTICAGNTSSLSANASGGTGSFTYNWEPGNLSGGNHTVNPIINTIYTVTATDLNGCSSISTQNIDVYSLPNINISGGVTPICSGSTVKLTASGALNYNWTSGQSSASISVSPTLTSFYTVSGTDTNGCSNTASKTITVTGICATTSVPCGITISNMSATSSAVNVAGAINYRFNFYNSVTNALIASKIQASRTFTFNTVPGLYYGNTYKWTVAVDKGTGFGQESNSSCTVTFTAPKTTVPCGVSYSNLSAYTTCQFISAAKNYRFKFYNNSTNALMAVKTQTSNYIYFNTVSGLAYGNTYKWTVEVEYNNGSTLLYGPASSTACTITFSPPKTTVPCGVTYAKNAYTSVPFVSGANAFRYNFYDATTNALIATTTNTNQYIYFNQVPNLIFNKAYKWTVEVRYYNGSGNVFGPPSTNTCTMNYGTPSGIMINDNTHDSFARIHEENSDNSSSLFYITIFPNPTKDIIKIESSDKIKTVKIYNITGELVLETELLNEIDLSSLKTGLYFVSVQTENHHKNIKIIKE